MTVILLWNPAFSAYRMCDFLNDIVALANEKYDRQLSWPVWDDKKVSAGDRFFIVKTGLGQNGIVACGTVTSNPYWHEPKDYREHQTYYVDIMPELMLSPDTIYLLSSEKLQEELPEIEWTGRKSGYVLNPEQEKTMDKVWSEFYNRYHIIFEIKMDRIENDQVWDKESVKFLKRGVIIIE